MLKNFYCAALLFLSVYVEAQVKILFDASHGQSAGNADWVIDADLHNMGWGSSGGYTCTCSSNESNAQRLPTPTQTAVTTATPETYWSGAISHWAIDCVNKGYWVETLPFGGALTYGNTSNVQDLSNYTIFIADEPNTLFTVAEKTALMNFVINGGSLLMISDHDASDRNGDGYDSPAIWNNFISNNGVSNNTLGFKFALENFSGTFTNVVLSPSDSLLNGPNGNVTKVQWAGGTCMNIFPSQNASAKAVVYRNGVVQGDSAALVVYARLGCGKVAAMGDSSPADDGTGDPNDNSLYDGYTTDAAGNHKKLLLNMVDWLAAGNCNNNIKATERNVELSVYPNPATSAMSITLSNFNGAPGSLHIYNSAGVEQSIPLELSVQATTHTYDLKTGAVAAGVYYCQIRSGGELLTRKLVIVK